MNPDRKEIHMDLAGLFSNLSSNVAGGLNVLFAGFGDLFQGIVDALV